MSLRPVTLYDANNVAMAVSDGVAIPAGTQGLLGEGKDENNNSRIPIVESKLNAKVTVEAATYGARYSPDNAAFTSAAIYTRKAYGHIATAAVTTVQVKEANTIADMFLSNAAATASFKVKSTSANDTAAGTGVRTVTIIYFGTDGLRYSATATMNGVTDVTVALSPSANGIQEVYATSAGTGLVAAGTITVKNTANTVTLGQIATGSTRTISSVHIVPDSKTLYLRTLRLSAKGVATTFSLIWNPYDYVNGTATGMQNVIVDAYRTIIGMGPPIIYDPPLALKVSASQVGRLWLTTAPDSNTASDYYVSLSMFEM